MISLMRGVTNVQDIGTISNKNAFRSPFIPSVDTNALTVDAASLGLPSAVGTTMAHGVFLNAATGKEPVAVLGAAAAQRMGIARVWPGERIWVGSQWFYLAGILKPAVLAPEIGRLRLREGLGGRHPATGLGRGARRRAGHRRRRRAAARAPRRPHVTHRGAVDPLTSTPGPVAG